MNASRNREPTGDVWPRGAPTVGQRGEISREIRPDYIDLFAEISGDRNPLHFDAAVAAASPFGEIVVHGGITSAVLNALVAEELPGPGTVFLQLDLSFRAPARPGDVITGRCEVLSVRDDKPICELAVEVRRQDGVVAIEGRAVCFTAPLG